LHAAPGVDGDDLVAGDYCVSFEWPGDETWTPKFSDIPHLDHGDGGASGGCLRGVQQAMLIDRRQFMKLPENARSGVLPAVIRLQTLEDCRRVCVNALHLGPAAARQWFSFSVELPPESGSAVEDREFGSLGELGRNTPSGVCHEKLKGEVIESGSVLVQAFTDQESQPRRRTADLLDFEHDAWGLRVVLHGESLAIWVSPELADRIHKGLKTVCRSIQL
jgi:hypothetical protein